ncbi:MAG: hypothetical protein EOM50_04555 [Erysipelotrichia bacterium]|nr:hypothetical protein [Erysipelotrichia bacterium]
MSRFKFKELGIDLGNSTIKIATVDKIHTRTSSMIPVLNRLGAHEVYSVDCTPYSPEYFSFLKSCLKQFSKKYKLRNISLNITIPLDNLESHIHFFDMPIVDKKLLSDGVSYEAEQLMDSESIYNSEYTWKINEEKLETKEYEILLATLSKSLINSLASFKTINWKVNRLILQPVLLERFTENNDVIIDFGHLSTRVYLYKKGLLSETELINIGAKQLIEKVKIYLDNHQIQDVSAQEIIKHVAIRNKKWEEIVHIPKSKGQENSEFVEESLDNLSDTVNKDSDEDSNLTNADLDSFLMDLGSDNSDDQEKVVEVAKKEDLNETLDEIDSFLSDLNIVPNQEDYKSFNEPKLKEHKKLELLNEEESELLEEKGEHPSEIELFDEESKKEDEYDEDLLRELSFVIDEDINSMVTEIKRAIRMFELKTGQSVDNIYYFGQVSKMSILTSIIESELEMKLKPIEILDMAEEGLVSLYSIASLASMDPKLKDNTDFSKHIKPNIDYNSVIVILLTLALSTGLAFKLISDKYQEEISNLNSIAPTQQQTLMKLNDDISSLNSSIADYDSFIERTDALKAQQKWLSDVLFLLPDRTPLTIAIHDIAILDGQVTIKGYSSDYSSIGFFANKLEDIAKIEIKSIDEFNPSDGNIYSVTMDTPELISDKYKIEKEFTITLSYDGPLLDH